MKILWLTPELPFPPNNGHRYVYFNRIKRMHRLGHKIDVFTLYSSGDSPIVAKMYENICNSITVVKKDKKHMAMFSITPYHVRKMYSLELENKLKEYISCNKIDIAMVDSLCMTIYNHILFHKNIMKRCYNVHNIDHILLFRSSRKTKKLIDKIKYAAEGIKSFFYEKKIYKNRVYSYFTFVSKAEAVYAKSLYNITSLLHSPIGAEAISLDKQDINCSSNMNIVFVGNLSYFSNIESLQWFLDKVYPTIKQKCHDVKLYIVGKSPQKEMINACAHDKSITIHQNVKNVSKYISIASVVIAPMVSGAGTKVKIVESLALGKIVVTTNLGAEGTDLIHMKHLLVAKNNNHHQFAQLCIDVLKCHEKYSFIAQNGLDHVRKKLNWDTIICEFNDYLTLSQGEQFDQEHGYAVQI